MSRVFLMVSVMLMVAAISFAEESPCIVEGHELDPVIAKISEVANSYTPRFQK